jgi:endonuclease/exonuclease/phosphatase family metal-dependent hydrolase
MLRILTYNTKLRSWMMEVGFPPSLPPVDTAEERASYIANNILASAADYDIVCLNEVFDEDARVVLSDGLVAKYPFQVTKADLLYTELRQPGVLNSISNAVFDVVFQPLLDVAALFALKLEDSGLMLASRWPFDTVPLPPEAAALLDPGQVAALFPSGLPAVSFMPYSDCDGGVMADCRSAKGVLWARLRRDPQHAVDVFISHTQADADAVEEYAESRDKQLLAAWKFITERVGNPPFANPTLFLGDFNVPAGAAEDAVPAVEWTRLFNRPGSPLTDHLADQWGTVQCRGGGTGLNDPGYTADVRYRPERQRLDIIAADVGPDLATQHVYVDYPVSAVPAGASPGVSFLSDHLPLAIDVGTRHPGAAAHEAETVSVDDFHSGFRGRGPGEVSWFRYDRMGTYEFRLDTQDPTVFYEVYLGDDLSRPRRPYRNERHPDFGDRFVLVAPFFIKVGNRRRDREFGFEFNSHRHSGADPLEAIHLIPGVLHPEGFPAQQLNGSSAMADWSDDDTMWFLLEAPRVPIDVMRFSVALKVTSGVGPLQLLIARKNPDGTATLIDRTDPAADGGLLKWKTAPDESYYVCVQRHDPSFARTEFTLLADIDVSMLRGGPDGQVRLVCDEETSGWGADDISLTLKADSGWSVEISNDEFGDMEQDDVRYLDPWIPQVVAYHNELVVQVVEEDDIDPNDVGSVSIPGFDALATWPSWNLIHADSTGRLTGSVRIEVDDGAYTFRGSISKWDESV